MTYLHRGNVIWNLVHGHVHCRAVVCTGERGGKLSGWGREYTAIFMFHVCQIFVGSGEVTGAGVKAIVGHCLRHSDFLSRLFLYVRTLHKRFIHAERHQVSSKNA